MGWRNSWMGTAQGNYSQDWLQDRVRKSARVQENSTQLGGTSSSARHSSILTICSCHQLVAPPPRAYPLSSEANNNPRLLYPPFRALSTPPRSER